MAAEFIIAATKQGYDVQTESNIHNYVFHSKYNGFKIIKTGISTFTLAGSTNNQDFNVAHGLPFIPLVTAFAKRTGINNVIVPNTNMNIGGFSVLQVCLIGVPTSSVFFVRISANATNMTFRFHNTGSGTTVNVRWFCLEKIA